MRKLDLISEPKGASGCVIVLHEVWGLSEHMKDVCKRLGKLGFAAAAPDLYRGYEGLLTVGNIRRAMEAVWDLSLDERRERPKLDAMLAKGQAGPEVVEAARTLYDRAFRKGILENIIEMVEEADSRFGGASTLGFSFGGGISFKVAARSTGLKSAAAYYGEPPSYDELRKITAPLLAIYAGEDVFMNRRVPAFVEEAGKLRKDLTLKTFPGTKHGFFDDTKKASHNKDGAAKAWDITTQFLVRTLGAPMSASKSDK